ncbi:MAG: lipopolysaccharide biosynthesis protein [Acidimicrobiales bacterium]
MAGAIGSLALVPLASRSLSQEEFGVWIVLSTLSALLAFSDFGIANALVSDLAASAETGDVAAFRSLVTTGAGLLALLGAMLVVLGIVLPQVLDVNRLLGVPGENSFVSSTQAAQAYLAILGLSLPLTAAVRILVAIERSDTAAKLAIAATAVQVLLGGLASVWHGGLVVFTMVAAGPGLLTGAAAWIACIRFYPPARPALSSIQPAVAKRLLGQGGAYATIGLAGALGFETDAFIIANRLGSTGGAAYMVPAKLFLMVPALVGVYFTSLWPAVARARARRDRTWLLARFRRTGIAAVVTSTAAAIAVGFLVRPAVEVLAPNVPRPGLALVVILAGLAVVLSSSVPVASFLSGLNLVRSQAVSAVAMATANLVGSILLVRHLGLTGPPLATVGCQAVITLAPLTFLVLRHIKSTNDSQWATNQAKTI